MPIITFDEATNPGSHTCTAASAYTDHVYGVITELYKQLVSPFSASSSTSFRALWESILDNIDLPEDDVGRFMSHRHRYQTIRDDVSQFKKEDMDKLVVFPYIDPEKAPAELKDEMLVRQKIRTFFRATNNPNDHESEIHRNMAPNLNKEVTLSPHVKELLQYIDLVSKEAPEYTKNITMLRQEVEKLKPIDNTTAIFDLFRQAFAIRCASSTPGMKSIEDTPIKHFATLLADILDCLNIMSQTTSMLLKLCPVRLASPEEMQKIYSLLRHPLCLRILQDALPWRPSPLDIRNLKVGQYISEIPYINGYNGAGVQLVQDIAYEAGYIVAYLQQQVPAATAGGGYKPDVAASSPGEEAGIKNRLKLKPGTIVKLHKRHEIMWQQQYMSLINRLSHSDKVAICSVVSPDLSKEFAMQLFPSDLLTLVTTLNAYTLSSHVAITDIERLLTLKKIDSSKISELPVFKDIFAFIGMDDLNLERFPEKIKVKECFEDMSKTGEASEMQTIFNEIVRTYYIPAIEKTMEDWDIEHQKDESVTNAITASIAFQVILLLTTQPHRVPRDKKRVEKSSVPIKTKPITPQEEEILSREINHEAAAAVRDLLGVCDLSLTTTNGRKILIPVLTRVGLDKAPAIQTKFLSARCEAFSKFAKDRIPADFRDRRFIADPSLTLDENLRELIKLTLGNTIPYHNIFSFEVEQYPKLYKALEMAIDRILKATIHSLSEAPEKHSKRASNVVGALQQSRCLIAILHIVPPDILYRTLYEHPLNQSKEEVIMQPLVEILLAPGQNANLTNKQYLATRNFGSIGDLFDTASKILTEELKCAAPKLALAPNYTALATLKDFPKMLSAASGTALTALRGRLSELVSAGLLFHKEQRDTDLLGCICPRKNDLYDPEDIWVGVPCILKKSMAWAEIRKNIRGITPSSDWKNMEKLYFDHCALADTHDYPQEYELTPGETIRHMVSAFTSSIWGLFSTPQPVPAKQGPLEHEEINRFVNELEAAQNSHLNSSSWSGVRWFMAHSSSQRAQTGVEALYSN